MRVCAVAPASPGKTRECVVGCRVWGVYVCVSICLCYVTPRCPTLHPPLPPLTPSSVTPPSPFPPLTRSWPSTLNASLRVRGPPPGEAEGEAVEVLVVLIELGEARRTREAGEVGEVGEEEGDRARPSA